MAIESDEAQEEPTEWTQIQKQKNHYYNRTKGINQF